MRITPRLANRHGDFTPSLQKTNPGATHGKAISWMTGGGSAWVTGSYDPELNLVYWGTGNPAPDWNGAVRRGDNLYTDCIVALDADTGKLKWYFQATPHDLWDWERRGVNPS